LYNKNNQQEEERSEVVMGIKRRQYSKEQKEEMVQKALSGKSVLELGKENNISPGLINRWKRQYLGGELKDNNNQEIKKLQIQVAKLEQMIGKLTMGTIF
jgi:transposase-like protein